MGAGRDLELEKFETWENRPWGQPWEGHADILAAAAEITEIGIARDMCYGTCPVYDLVLKRTGEARFEGKYFVLLLGLHTAPLEAGAFEELARAVVFLGFRSLENSYTIAVTDMPTTTTWIRVGSRRVEVSAYGASGPRALRVVEGLIDGCGASLDWQPVSNNNTPGDTRPIFVGSTLESGDLPGEAADEQTHWTQRRRGAAAASRTTGSNTPTDRTQQRVRLRAERNGRDSRYLDAYMDDEGNLHIDGQDLGPSTSSVSSDGEYEWFEVIPAAALPRLKALLGANPGEHILEVLERSWTGARSYDLETILRESDMDMSRHVWSG